MRDQSPDVESRDDQADIPIGIPLTAIIAVVFLFGSSFFSPNQKSSEVTVTQVEHAGESTLSGSH